MSVIAEHAAEVWVRRYNGVPECEVDAVEAQRCRRAQYVGFPTAVTLGGSKFVGLVQSVKQEVGPRWIVTIIPKQPEVFAVPRYRPHHI
jgi:hypothetical protein